MNGRDCLGGNCTKHPDIPGSENWTAFTLVKEKFRSGKYDFLFPINKKHLILDPELASLIA